MRFTEHELTVAVTEAAKTVASARRPGRRGGGWETMSRIDRYHVMDAVGGEVLPVLIALPDVEVPAGTRPTFTDEQVRAAVQQVAGEGRGLRHRARLLARTTLVRSALERLPVRHDPDALLDPDPGGEPDQP